MDHWNAFDACCIVGRHLKLQEGGLYTADHLLAEMDHYGITEALVLDSLGRENHPDEGNTRILETVKRSPRLHPVWSALPHGPADEQLEPGPFLDAMRRNRVGALFLFPRQYRFTLDPWCVDALLEPLAEARVPVFVNNTEITHGWPAQDAVDLPAMVALCRRWPTLPVIISENRIRQSQRLVYKALDACENLHVELSCWWLHRGIEFITEHWGARRLLFGSNWPAFGQHMTLTPLTTADIGDADKRLIAGDNLRRLVAWCKPEHPVVQIPAPADEFVQFGRTGQRPATMTFADCHGHIGGRACHYHLPGCTTDGIAADMDRLGDAKACVFSFGGVFSDEVHGNDTVIEAVRRYPDKFVGFTLLNPHRGRDEMLRELERCAKQGLRGVKLIPHYQGYPEEGALIEVACQWADERRQIILNHGWGPVAQIERLTAKYPNACFIQGHTYLGYAEVARRRDNLFMCSCPLIGPRACEEMVAAIGADKLLFGSDLQDLPIAWGLGPIIFARLSPEQKRMILGGNLQRILKEFSVVSY